VSVHNRYDTVYGVGIKSKEKHSVSNTVVKVTVTAG